MEIEERRLFLAGLLALTVAPRLLGETLSRDSHSGFGETSGGACMKEQRVALLAGRIALAAGFLSAVADRFGLWGRPGSSHAAWGDWSHFAANVATLNWFMPAPVIPLLASVTTLAESMLGILLLIGYRLRWTAYGSALLLVLYFVTMTMAHGVRVPLDYSVFTAFATALLIGVDTNHNELPSESKAA
jgi:putative oxidoreductase